jgi:8-demethyl-8-alpha-L-rhamnosyltetracenomycin-C 2'-O-methyltransferase
MLEIGIGGYGALRYGGHSLYMWRSYFPRATVYGVEIHEKELESYSRIVVLRADQSDRESLSQAVAQCPPLDLVVDDGSHIGADVITAFEVLFPLLRPGGTYAIEDVYYAYQPEFGGGPPGEPGTSIDLVKRLLDDLNLERGQVAAVHAYPGLVLLKRADSDQKVRRGR